LYTWAGAHPADMGPRGERAIDALLASRTHARKQPWGQETLEELTAKWLSDLGIIDDFRLEELKEGRRLYEARVVTSTGAPEVLITDVGFGVSQILPVIVLCYYAPEGSTIILEQPEIHLHPSVQAGLADVFIDAIKKRKVQIIIESHSEHLLRRLQRRIAEEQIAADDASLYFCDLKGGSSRARQLEVDTFGNITNWPENFFGDEIGDLAAMTEAAIRRAERNQRS
jgi:predicted ATPase